MNSTIIFIAGLPKAGKSLLCSGIYRFLSEKRESFFIERLSPDSEGMWTSESADGLDRARQIKNRLKEKGLFFSPDFVRAKCQSIIRLAQFFQKVFLDMGGIPSEENRRFVETALQTSARIEALVLYPKGTQPDIWVEFFTNLGIKPRLVETSWDFSQDVKEQAYVLAQKILPALGE